MQSTNPIHVAVGVLINASNQVLIAFRDPSSHQGGLWEFPGGKVEQGETVVTALKREFAEELGIEVLACTPYKKIRHEYSDKPVLLDIWLITSFSGEPSGREGQAIRWQEIGKLRVKDFPAANASIIKLLSLPREIGITPDAKSSLELEQLIEKMLAVKLELIQFRQTHIQPEIFSSRLRKILPVCLASSVKVVVNQGLEGFLNSGASGLHLNSRRLMQLKSRPVSSDFLFSASCHNLEELRHAESVDADFVFLSPVKDHPKYGVGTGMGWKKFGSLVNQVSLPVYALSGLGRQDLHEAMQHGAWGIAGIRAFIED